MRPVLTLLFVVFVGVFGEPSETEVNTYVNAIANLQGDARNYTTPTDFTEYLQGNSPNQTCTQNGTYDYIIVGAGPAGSVLAARLSENPSWTVQVLEAGQNGNFMTDVPAFSDYFKTIQYNWGYTSVPQKYSEAFINRSLIMTTGKANGGSSVISYNIYDRGNRNDFDRWARRGNPGWSYRDVLAYFKKSEHVAFPDADPEYHGENGNLNVEYIRYFDEVAQAYVAGEEELGARRLSDYNAAEQIGVSILQTNTINGSRDSAAKAFLDRASYRSNLNIYLETFVQKILINEHSKKAYGVQYLRNGKCYYSRATKEVILSAGALNSPRLLMVSGVGPRQHLENLGIKVIQDLPVGSNLWMHGGYYLQHYNTNYTYPNNTVANKIREYLEGTGIYTTSAGTQAVAFANVMNPEAAVPDTEYWFGLNPPHPQPYDTYRNALGITEEAYYNIATTQENFTSCNVFALLLHPKSRGSVTLKSSSLYDFPVIDPNFLAESEDVEILVKAVKHIQSVSETAPMQRFDVQRINVSLEVCNDIPRNSDDFIRCMVRNLASTLYDYGGTCSMGPVGDQEAVVDARLLVHGIRNLRVVDTSVIPVTTSGQLAAVAYMIGEKAADIIKQHYR